MPSDRTLGALNRLHRFVLRVTGGRLGWRAGGMPVVELTTTGRRSGEPRSVMLTAAVVRGDSFMVVASRGGDDHHPAWFLNLRANPEVEVVTAGRVKRPMRARVATPAERAELWPRVEARYPGYRRYQRRTAREIPLVFLDPR